MDRYRCMQSKITRKVEIGTLCLAVVLYFLLRLGGLRHQPINMLFDEGIYLILMKLLSAGQGILYRDFVVAHPPGLLWAGAWLWKATHGDIYVMRVVYITFCGVAFLPIYAIMR